MKVVRFNGVTKAEFLSRKEFDNGCIFKQMEDALEYSLNVLNIIQTNIVGKERVDTPYFNSEAFREAWFNAVCHNLDSNSCGIVALSKDKNIKRREQNANNEYYADSAGRKR